MGLVACQKGHSLSDSYPILCPAASSDFKSKSFANLWSKDDYIPESLFYRLGMKASNTVADKLRISVRIGLNLPFMGKSREI